MAKLFTWFVTLGGKPGAHLRLGFTVIKQQHLRLAALRDSEIEELS